MNMAALATTPSLATRIFDLAERVQVNVPNHRDPQAFHVELSEIVRELKEIAMEAGG